MNGTRMQFHGQLEQLQDSLQLMGNRVVDAIENAVRSLSRRDLELAKAVIQGDEEINRMHLEIESKCIRLLATQQPLAKDLRLISTAWKTVTDLERAADHAVDIAKASLRLGGEELPKPLVDIPRMAELAISMVREALDAFAALDEERAQAMIKRDHEVDGYHARVIMDLNNLMQVRPETVSACSQLLFVSHSLERIGDHATNLGEWLIYLVTGQYRELNN